MLGYIGNENLSKNEIKKKIRDECLALCECLYVCDWLWARCAANRDYFIRATQTLKIGLTHGEKCVHNPFVSGSFQFNLRHSMPCVHAIQVDFHQWRKRVCRKVNRKIPFRWRISQCFFFPIHIALNGLRCLPFAFAGHDSGLRVAHTMASISTIIYSGGGGRYAFIHWFFINECGDE